MLFPELPKKLFCDDFRQFNMAFLSLKDIFLPNSFSFLFAREEQQQLFFRCCCSSRETISTHKNTPAKTTRNKPQNSQKNQPLLLPEHISD
jgi:hypothetical protein